MVEAADGESPPMNMRRNLPNGHQVTFYNQRLSAKMLVVNSSLLRFKLFFLGP